MVIGIVVRMLALRVGKLYTVSRDIGTVYKSKTWVSIAVTY